MEKDEILKNVAPCSLMCYTCSAYNNGVICEASNNLLKYLNGIKEFYKSHMLDAVESYANFESVLNMFCAGPCSGCRSTEHNVCSIKGCFLLVCTKEHGVDFCGECNEFPCERTRTLFEDEVYEQWLNGNQQIKENGINYFWENNSAKPHYEAYKNSHK